MQKQARSGKDELEKISNSVGADKIYTTGVAAAISCGAGRQLWHLFMRHLILVRHVFYAARGIVLRRNFINLSARRFLKFCIIVGLNCRLKFRRRMQCGVSKA